MKVVEEIFNIIFGNISNPAGREQAKQDIGDWLSTQKLPATHKELANKYEADTLPWQTTKYSK